MQSASDHHLYCFCTYLFLQINTALTELTSAVKDVCAFHRGEGSASTTPSFLFTVPQEAYHAAEDSYLTELTAFTRKQFFQVSQIAQHVIESLTLQVWGLVLTKRSLLSLLLHKQKEGS